MYRILFILMLLCPLAVSAQTSRIMRAQDVVNALGYTPQAALGTFGVNNLLIGTGSAGGIADSSNATSGVANLPVALFSLQSPSSAPSSVCSTSFVLTAFNCDLSKMTYAVGTNITGTSTLGTPTSGYMNNPNLSLFYGYYSNDSGHNQSTSGNGGRTNGSAIFVKADALGQGDTSILYGNVFVNSALAGATSFLANPAGQIVTGGVSAGQAGVYLQGIGDIDLTDNGFDVAGIGVVVNLSRSNATGALGATWLGVRIQSTSTAAVDAFYSASGLASYGVDLSNANFGTNQAAIALSANQRIYGNATAGNFFPSSPGTSYLTWNSSASAWQLIAAGTTQLTVSSSYVGVINATSVNTGDHFGVVGSSAGALGMTVDNSNAGTASQTTLNLGNSTATNEAGIILNGGSFSGGQGANALQIKNAAGQLIVLGTGTEILKVGTTGGFTANASTSVSLTAVAPAGAHATVQEWLTITDSSGTVRYIPAF